MTKRERAKDEQILAAIIAGGVSSGRTVEPSYGRGGRARYNGYGVMAQDNPTGPCCAVGAGVLYGGIAITHRPSETFALVHGVSSAYASGVSDGFENMSMFFHDLESPRAFAEYSRGYAVGAAAYDYFHGSDGAS